MSYLRGSILLYESHSLCFLLYFILSLLLSNCCKYMSRGKKYVSISNLPFSHFTQNCKIFDHFEPIEVPCSKKKSLPLSMNYKLITPTVPHAQSGGGDTTQVRFSHIHCHAGSQCCENVRLGEGLNRGSLELVTLFDMCQRISPLSYLVVPTTIPNFQSSHSSRC